MRVFGIDPGQKGGIAMLDNQGGPVFQQSMPVQNKLVLTGELVNILAIYAPDKVIIEKQSIRGGQAGAMAIGSNYGRLMACIEYLGLPHREVTPGVWNKALGIPSGLKGRAKKEAAFALAGRTWGRKFTDLNIGISKDGIYEAMLIARYGWQSGK